MKHIIKRKAMPKVFFVIGMSLSLIIGTVYIYRTWENTNLRAENEAIALAESAASFIEPEQLMLLKVDSTDINLETYQMVKRGVSEFKKRNPQIAYAYLFKLMDGHLYFMADSELSEAEGYSQPGQEYYEATEQDILPFSTGKSLLTEPLTDRWGIWVSALVPITDPKTGTVIAMFGIDYPAEYWKAEIVKNVIPSVVIVFIFLLFLFVLYRIVLSNIKSQILSQQLHESEAIFKAVFEQAPVGISLVNNYKSQSQTNAEFARILSRSKEEISLLNWDDITHQDDLFEDTKQFARFKTREISGYSMEKRYIKPDGSFTWVQMVIARIQINGVSSNSWDHLCIVQDINSRKTTEKTLRESERSKSMLLANLPGMAYRCKFDSDWTMEFVSEGCSALTGYKPKSLIGNNELSFNDLVLPEFREPLWSEWEHTIKLKRSLRYEYKIATASGQQKWVLETGQAVFSEDGSVEALEGIIVDITESRKRLEQIQYINEHDYMTGLYNRRHYELEKERLDYESRTPISIIIADINGVRLINDAFGHSEGDRLIIETAKLIESRCREGDLLARTGGDDFTIILPDTGHDKAYEIANIIKESCEKFNRTISNNEKYLNLSIGFGTKENEYGSMDNAEKEAEEYLRKRKLFERKSYHNAVLSSIMATMYARSHETEAHSLRISGLCRKIAEKMCLPQKLMDELHLFSMLHDIGKVGIDDRILNKPDSLTNTESHIMETHPEIGYKIAMAAPELESVAEYILSHHERWDGSGYPNGKCGEEIPLLSRILAVADTYDAMTEDRVYRKAMSKEAALEEIERNAGTQFDPNIVRVFMDSILESSDYQ